MKKNESDSKKKRTKLEQYIETRLWNAKKMVKGYTVSTEKILDEINVRYFKGTLPRKPETRKDLVIKINGARNRIDSRWSWLEKQSKAWSEMLNIHQYSMLELIRLGYVETVHDVRRIRQIFLISDIIKE